MKLHFTKMHGAGNDFIVIDAISQDIDFTPAQWQRLADRRFGIGADQILCVRPAPSPDVDFEYVIHNADGQEVEHCGNGARCFFQFVREHGCDQVQGFLFSRAVPAEEATALVARGVFAL